MFLSYSITIRGQLVEKEAPDCFTCSINQTFPNNFHWFLSVVKAPTAELNHFEFLLVWNKIQKKILPTNSNQISEGKIFVKAKK